MESPEEYFAKRGIKKEHVVNWALDFAKRRETIKAFPGVRQRLEELKRAGADPETVVTGIVLMYPGGEKSTRRQLRKLRVRLTALGNRLEELHREIENTVSDPWCYASFWRAVLIDPNGDLAATEKEWAAARKAANRVKVFVNFFRGEAHALAGMSREHEKSQIVDRLGPVLRYVKQSTGKFHDECMADILQGAHDALGVKATFSGEKLKKMRQRGLRVLLRNRKPTATEEIYGGL